MRENEAAVHTNPYEFQEVRAEAAWHLRTLYPTLGDQGELFNSVAAELAKMRALSGCESPGVRMVVKPQ